LTYVDDAKGRLSAFLFVFAGQIEKRQQQADVDRNDRRNYGAPCLEADLRLISHCRSTPAAPMALRSRETSRKQRRMLFLEHAALLQFESED
jgi:hypothetical protein